MPSVTLPCRLIIYNSINVFPLTKLRGPTLPSPPPPPQFQILDSQALLCNTWLATRGISQFFIIIMLTNNLMLLCSLNIGGCNSRYQFTSSGRAILLNRGDERVCLECFYPDIQFQPYPETTWVAGNAGHTASRLMNQLAVLGGIRSEWIDGLLLLLFVNDAIPVDGPDGRFQIQCSSQTESLSNYAISIG